MSKILREVGFLALGMVAVLEVCIYGRFWAWEGHVVAGFLTALFILLQGAYFSLDGTAWGDFWKHVNDLKAAGFKEPKEYYESLAKRASVGWCIDFAALLLGAASLGISTQLLASFELDHLKAVLTADQLLHLEESRKLVLGSAGTCLTLMFILTVAYWFYLERERATDPKAKEFSDASKGIWKYADEPKVLKWVFCVPVAVSAILTWRAYREGPSITVLVCADVALALLVVLYRLSRQEWPISTPTAGTSGAVFSTPASPVPIPGAPTPTRSKLDRVSFWLAAGCLAVLTTGLIGLVSEAYILGIWLKCVFFAAVGMLVLLLFRFIYRRYYV